MLLIILFLLITNSLSSQYSCGCGFVTLNNLSLSPAGPGCTVNAEVTITSTSASCVNNSWTWNTTPSGSSGSIYVGFSNGATVPFSANSTLNFYMPQACNDLGNAFINFAAPVGPCTSVPLPIKLKNIYQKDNNIVWVTESEVNCSHYIIEGSNDGKQWVKIEETTCNNISTRSTYALNILPAMNFLRLVQYDFDGNTFISDVIKWKNPVASPIKTYSGKMIFQGEDLMLTLLIGHEIGNISVWDFFGKNHYNGNVQSFDSSVLPSGQYLITIFDEHSIEINKLRLVVL